MRKSVIFALRACYDQNIDWLEFFKMKEQYMYHSVTKYLECTTLLFKGVCLLMIVDLWKTPLFLKPIFCFVQGFESSAVTDLLTEHHCFHRKNKIFAHSYVFPARPHWNWLLMPKIRELCSLFVRGETVQRNNMAASGNVKCRMCTDFNNKMWSLRENQRDGNVVP